MATDVWSSSCRLPKAEVTSTNTKEPRKILLDCGANVASTVQLFRETYPDGQDFIIHSFEIDERLAPFFAPYPNHVLHSPTGVANKDGNMTAYSELVWSPDKGLNNGKDMQWGGGSLFAYEDEKKDTETGGKRKLSHHRTVPTVDLSRWIQENTAVEDYVIFKLDVEGAEYDILQKMLEDGTFKWVDKYYGEFHSWQPVTGWDKKKKDQLVSDVQKKGKPFLVWEAEYRNYRDFDKLHPPLRATTTYGKERKANKDNITRPTNLENTTSSANVVRTVEPQTSMFASAERLSNTRAIYHLTFVFLACLDHEISKPEVLLQYHDKPPDGSLALATPSPHQPITSSRTNKRQRDWLVAFPPTTGKGLSNWLTVLTTDRRQVSKGRCRAVGGIDFLVNCWRHASVSESFVGTPGTVYSGCHAPPSGAPRLTLAVLVGMNAKAGHKLVETIAAHSSRMPVTLFLYGDFVETFPELVTEWAKTFTIGMREGQPFPLGHFTLQAQSWIRMGLVSTIQRLSEVDLQTAYYFPEHVTDAVKSEAKSRGLRIFQPTARFPPRDEKWLLSVANYYKYRDVERVPKALRVIANQLEDKGGIVSLDSDHPDSYMISVFLMDYLAEKSGYNLVSITECLK
ncbi:hypothetical protein Bbelb_386270 [Branchiostoma belcheri]|nr:hypothetical protein Bbelb_386270 [Branchiostoma belcheri]